MFRPNRYPGFTRRTTVRWWRMVVQYGTAWPCRYNILFNLFLGAIIDCCRWSHSAWCIPFCNFCELIPWRQTEPDLPFKWLRRFYTLLDYKRRQQSTPKVLTAEQAAAMIMSSSYQPLDIIGFDSVDASRINIQKGDTVSITPTDTGKQTFNGHDSRLWHFPIPSRHTASDNR